MSNYKRKRSVKTAPATCQCKTYKRAGNSSERRTDKENAKRETAAKEIREGS